MIFFVYIFFFSILLELYLDMVFYQCNLWYSSQAFVLMIFWCLDTARVSLSFSLRSV